MKLPVTYIVGPAPANYAFKVSMHKTLTEWMLETLGYEAIAYFDGEHDALNIHFDSEDDLALFMIKAGAQLMINVAVQR